MPFSEKRKTKIAEAWRDLVENCNYISLYEGFDNNAQLGKLCKILTSDEDTRKYISEENIVDIIRYWVSTKSREGNLDWDTNKKIKNIIEEKEISNGEHHLIEIIENLPHTCNSYFPIYTKVPEEIDIVSFTEDIKLVSSEAVKKLYNKDSIHISRLVGALSGTTYSPEPKHYISIQTKGFPGMYGNGNAIKEANQKLRKLLYLFGLTKYAELSAYKQPSTLPYCFYFTEMDNNKSIHTLSVTQSTIYGLANFSFKDEIWEPAKILPPEGKSAQSILTISYEAPDKNHSRYKEAIIKNFETQTKALQNYWNINNNKKKSISRAIEWGFMGATNQDEEAGFIQTCIGLEAILGEETQIDSNRLYDRAAYMLGQSQEERESIFYDFSNIYKLRSSIVHGKKGLETSDQSLVWSAARLLNRIILHEVNMLLKES